MVTVSTPEASSLQITREAMAEADAVIRTLPEVASTSFAAGFDMLAGIASTSSGIIFVKLADYADRKLSAARIAQQLTGTLYVAVPGAECYAFIPPAIPGLGVTSGVSLEVQDLEGRGTAYLLEHTERLLDSLRALPSVASATTPFDAEVPQRRLRIDREQALAAEVDLGTLYGELTTCSAARTSTTSRVSESSTRPIFRRRPNTGATNVRSTTTTSLRPRGRASPWHRRSPRSSTRWAWPTSRSSTSTARSRSRSRPPPAPPRATVMQQITRTAGDRAPTTSARRGAASRTRKPTPRNGAVGLPAGAGVRFSPWRRSTNRGDRRWRS